jgi:hypothetical protein
VIKNFKTGGNINITGTPFQFSCSPSVTSILDLICISPNVSGLLIPFKSYPVSFVTNGSLGADFILYQKRKIFSVFPSVMPVSLSRYLLKIQIDQSVDITQGSVEINLGVGSPSLTRYKATSSDQLSFSNTDVGSLSAGSYRLGLYYRNPASLEFQ